MRSVTLPMDELTAKSLRAGEAVLLSGTVYTARDAAHKKMHECIRNGEPLPFEIRDASVYYVGPTPAKPGTAIGSAGPTTSSRMDAYTPELLDLGLRTMIGKGRRSEAVKEAIQRNHAVYFVCCGGAGALLSHAVQEREMLAWPELLSEAVTKLTVKDFPCFVGIDSLGNDIYEMEDEE